MLKSSTILNFNHLSASFSISSLINLQKKLLKPFDGNKAASHVAYHLSDLACIYPITPSSGMGENFEYWTTQNKKNIFNQVPVVKQLQSEAGAAGALHGCAVLGTLTSTFTASQGLLLMIPNMCKISGELLPTVFHVAARALSYQSLSIYGDHEDVTLTRSTGFCQLASGSVQEVMDLGTIAHLASLDASLPFLHFFEGFRISHEISSIYSLEKEDFDNLFDYESLKNFRERALSPESPRVIGHGEKPDLLFQHNEAANKYYLQVPKIVQNCMDKFYRQIGRKYNLFDYYGDEDAESIIVIFGAAAPVVQETVDYLNKNRKGPKVGLINVRLVRPFSAKHFLRALPKNVKRIAVLDRTKEYGGLYEPLFGDVSFVLSQAGRSDIKVIGGRFGLGVKDFTPEMCVSVFENLEKKESKNHFTIGIIDDVTHTSLRYSKELIELNDGFKGILYGVGGDGTVGAVKAAIKLTVANSQKHGQAFFQYSADKSFSVTKSYIRVGKEKITSQYIVRKGDIVACHNDIYLKSLDVVSGLKDGGIFLLNTEKSHEELEKFIPNKVKKQLADKNAQFYTLNSFKINKELDLGGRINQPLLSAFFKLTNILGDEKKFLPLMEEDYRNHYKLLDEDTIKININSMKKGVEYLDKWNLPIEKWKKIGLNEFEEEKKIGDKFLDDIFFKCKRGEGNEIRVSELPAGGGQQIGTSKYEKKGYSTEVSKWKRPDDCIQCNACVFSCPKTSIRPFILTKEEVEKAPIKMEVQPLKGKKQHKDKFFRIQISPFDCDGCGNCIEICPKNCLDLVRSLPEQETTAKLCDYLYTNENIPYRDDIFNQKDFKGLLFKEPHLEFASSCQGCSETIYAKVLTQAIGDRMVVANSSGCSSVWGAVYPRTPYCADRKGNGPSWGRSLFEDTAEYGYGMALGTEQRRDYLKIVSETIINDYKNDFDLRSSIPSDFIELLTEWTQNYKDSDKATSLGEKIKPLLNRIKNTAHRNIKKLKDNQQFFRKYSIWSFGGDGWAYDIGYPGVDHVLSSDTDMNILVMDTEVYSNTGGQASKATPHGAIAKFCASGNKKVKKNLAIRAMLYGNVYVSSCAHGDMKQMKHTLDSVYQADQYDGPSLLLAYSNCSGHGISKKMGWNKVEKLAVESGYWPIFTWDPRNKAKGKNPFTLKSKKPNFKKFKEFVNSQTRFTKLKKFEGNVFEKEILGNLWNDVNYNYHLYEMLAHDSDFYSKKE